MFEEDALEMHQIRYFLAVSDHDSFTRAAQLNYIFQPSLTQSIKKLEDELGWELFTRDRSECLLTSLGHLVVLSSILFKYKNGSMLPDANKRM
jgi:DNA-binding transcriptional LysR family regulator